MSNVRAIAGLSRWELAAETIAVKIRWFGLVIGYLLVNLGDGVEHQAILNAILALGACYALIDTVCGFEGRVFLGRWPLLISFMEALFIGLLCYYHHGLESPFRYYYILSLICCAIRHSTRVTYATWAMHSASLLLLYAALPIDQEKLRLVLSLVLIGWVTWASAALARLLKSVGEHLGELNAALEENQAQLEARIAERTRELQEVQAHMLHQEKMAAFGLLAAGIAHEVGNPLTSISALVQMLRRRDQDGYTREKLELVNGELRRIQTILHELVNFSRPASSVRTRVSVGEAVQEALNIVKYYGQTKGRKIETRIPVDLPAVLAVRDQLVQVFLNLVLNAIDATAPGGRIVLEGHRHGEDIEVTVQDNGSGIDPRHAVRLFQPYFTTKKHGTGLGLFVTRKLMTEHGGSVDFSSTPGQGTTFRLRLPAAPCPTEHIRDLASSIPTPLGSS